MRIAVVASDVPHPEGTAAGRDLWAWCEATIRLGHELDAWIWTRPPSAPAGPLPAWARYEPVVVPRTAATRWQALLRPRFGAGLAGWRPAPGAVAVADHVPSASAVAGLDRSVVTLHYRALADALAVRRLSPADVQTARAERRAARSARLVLAYSARVGRGLGAVVRHVPLTGPVADRALETVEEPVVALIADWAWPPNRLALRRLLRIWPEVRGAVPGAQLLVAGRNLSGDAVGILPGVEVLGPVASSLDVLSRAALVAFPCPGSSGPKAKTLEALAHGVPVVTTPAGMEGIAPSPEAERMVVGLGGFAWRVVELLRDPAERATLAAGAFQAVQAGHSPETAARARIDAFADVFGA